MLAEMNWYVEKNSSEEFLSHYGYFQRSIIGALVI